MVEMRAVTTVLTLALDEESQRRFDALRRAHYPPGLNRIPAHLSLFHQLPRDESTRRALEERARTTRAFAAEVTGVRSLGRGVAFVVQSAELQRLHGALAGAFQESLIAQDRQAFRPHVVVQNKAAPEEARALLGRLGEEFVPWSVRAEGLLWWEYLGGPWRLIERFEFAVSVGSEVS